MAIILFFYNLINFFYLSHYLTSSSGISEPGDTADEMTLHKVRANGKVTMGTDVGLKFAM